MITFKDVEEWLQMSVADAIPDLQHQMEELCQKHLEKHFPGFTGRVRVRITAKSMIVVTGQNEHLQ